MRRTTPATAGLILALVLALAACGGSGSEAQDAGATTLTIYSSLPLRGPSAAQSQSIVNAEKLALEATGSRVGRFTVKYVSLDDSAGPAGWDPKAVSAAARRAAQDTTTVGYLGDLDSGASAISIPVTNEAGILQVSPSNTAVGLTQSQNADKGEPEKYYPSGKRTFGRIIPADDVQAAVQVTYQRQQGCTRTYVLHDATFEGKGIADQVAAIAPSRGLGVAGTAAADAGGIEDGSVVQAVAASRADCVFFGGRTVNGAVALFTALHAALPAAKLFGTDGVADRAFTAALGAPVARQVLITTAAVHRRFLPAAGQAFFRTYRQRFGASPESLGVYGYEAMKVMLQAIADAGEDANDKQAVIDAFFAIRDRASVLGRYSIDENGDTTLTRYGAAIVRNGALASQRVIDAGSTG